MNRRLNIIITILGIVFLSGCATRLVDFTVISTKNIDLARGADFKRGPNRVKGEDKVSIIILFPTGTINIKTAIDKAIESVPGAVALLDGVLTAKGWYIPYIYGESSYVVEGTPLIDPKLVLAKRPSNYIFCRADRSGNVKEMRYLSKAEFELLRKKVGV